ncbi:uncharacterized protein LOC121387477 isoform X2 [Gigantopelta aegis]|uniref:uncharacterized protein LOC121387477 isoform X2 n=1 Tax=Gigantopelta aegis TaxID=1735272 RepID=UPI001B88A74E|nr:uncharacterized protein LOC121387477 isoform X2 [Gigantopelta aegis]
MSPYISENCNDIQSGNVISCEPYHKGSETDLASSYSLERSSPTRSKFVSEKPSLRLKGKTQPLSTGDITESQRMKNISDKLNGYLSSNSQTDHYIFNCFPDSKKMIQISLDVNVRGRWMQIYLLDSENLHLKRVADDKKNIMARIYLAKKPTLFSRTNVYLTPAQEVKMKGTVTFNHIGEYVINNYILHIEVFKKCQYTQATFSLGKTKVDMKMFQLQNNAILWKSLEPDSKPKGKIATCLGRLFGKNKN